MTTDLINKISLSDHVGISVFFRFLDRACAKTSGKEPDSLGDRLRRAYLKQIYQVSNGGLTQEWLAEAVDVLNEFEKSDVTQRNERAGFDVVRYIPYVIVA